MGLLDAVPLPYKLGAVALALGAVYFTGYWRGHLAASATAAKQQLAAMQQANMQAQAMAEKVKLAEWRAAQQEQRVKIVYRTVTKEVTKYAQTDNGRAASLAYDWLRVYNLSAVPTATDTGSGLTDSTGQLTNAEVLATAAANNETCNEWRSKLIRWQAWYAATVAPSP